MQKPLRDHAIAQGGIQRVRHPRLGVEINGQTAIRYLRFGRQVNLDRLELKAHAAGRWEPAVPTHPAHLLVQILDGATRRWQSVRDVTFPPVQAFRSEGLTRDTSEHDVNAHFKRAVENRPPYTVDLRGLSSDHLRVICDR